MRVVSKFDLNWIYSLVISTTSMCDKQQPQWFTVTVLAIICNINRRKNALKHFTVHVMNMDYFEVELFELNS